MEKINIIDNIMPETIGSLCSKKGVKLTKQRRIIADFLDKTNTHPTVEELYISIHKKAPHIGLATVYRTLKLLEEVGVIRRLDLGEGKARYEKQHSYQEHHHHLIDVETGKIVEFESRELENLKKKIALDLGYELVDCRLELYGMPIKRDKK